MNGPGVGGGRGAPGDKGAPRVTVAHLVAVVAALARRPDLWMTAVSQWLRLVGAGWWRRAPFLPVPPAGYLRFRLVTAYGGDGSPPTDTAGDDVVAYLQWCRQWSRLGTITSGGHAATASGGSAAAGSGDPGATASGGSAAAR